MIFSKSKKKQKLNRKWKIGNHDMEETDSYKYLGVIFKNNGSFLEHVQYKTEEANKALHTLIAKAKEWQGFAPEMLLHVFDHTVVPILNYEADVWGNYDWDVLEKVHLWTCKYELGVKQTTPTIGMYAELGRHPLLINRKISACKYLKRLETLDDRRLVKKALKQLSMDDGKGHFNWLSKILDDSKKFSVDTTLPEEVIKQKF